MADIAHIVVDWGTSSFRLWALDRTGRVLGERRDAQGLAASSADGFEHVLETHLSALGIPDGVPVMTCGMVGSRGGWIEAPYLDTPLRLDGLARQAVAARSSRRPVRILPGLAQRDPAHPDVMRGEETQLLALTREGGSGLVCLPGTHSKWVVLKEGAVERFATFMTGEIFHLLRTASVAAPAIEGAGPVEPDAPAFSGGVADALAAPESVGNRVFELRAGWLLAGAAATDALAHLSGLLIGLEIAGARARFGTLDGTILVAAAPAAGLYRRAFGITGTTGIKRRDAEACAREGLHRAALATFHTEGAPA